MSDVTTTNDISYIWTRLNPRWLLTGAVSGILAGIVMVLIAGWLSPRELTFPLKLIGASIFGGESMNQKTFGFAGVAGAIIHLTLAGFFGSVFAQAVKETTKKRLLFLLSMLAGMAVWLFWSMMFMPSLDEALFWHLPKTTSLFLHGIFGASFGLFIVLLRPRLLR